MQVNIFSLFSKIKFVFLLSFPALRSPSEKVYFWKIHNARLIMIWWKPKVRRYDDNSKHKHL